MSDMTRDSAVKILSETGIDNVDETIERAVQECREQGVEAVNFARELEAFAFLVRLREGLLIETKPTGPWLDYPGHRPTVATDYLVEFHAGHRGIVSTRTRQGDFYFDKDHWLYAKKFAEIRS